MNGTAVTNAPSESPARWVLEIVLRVGAAVLAVIGILLTWATSMATVTAALVVLAGISQLAQVGRGGIRAVDGRLDRLEDRVVTVEESAEQLAGNVADKGIILTLLPAEQEEALEDAAQQAVRGFENIQTAAETAAGLRRAVDGALSVLTGRPPEDRQGRIVTALAELEADAQALGTDIRDFREGRAARIDRVAAAAGRLEGRITEVRSRLVELDQDLANLQTGLDRAGRLIRAVFGLTALLATLAFLYVIWSQVVLMRRAGARRSTQPTAAGPITPTGDAG
jgi:uncharacterized protein YceH (UPF0502 family)